MGLNQEGTLARLKAVRKILVDPTIAFHPRGRIAERQPVTECWSKSPAQSMLYAVPLKSSAAWPNRMCQCLRTKRIEIQIWHATSATSFSMKTAYSAMALTSRLYF